MIHVSTDQAHISIPPHHYTVNNNFNWCGAVK